MRKLVWIIALLAFVLPFAAFAQDDMAMELIELPAVDPLSLSGDIITAGSSTVFPVTEAMAELFTAEGFAGTITVDSIGSGAGLERFCVTGETDIANASRAIEEDEVAACEAIGRAPIEFRVGTDALAVVVSSENDFVTDLSIAQLAAIFTGEVTLWSDVDPSFPAETIQLFSPGTDSGTYDYFVEAVLESDEGAALEGEAANAAILGVPGIQFSEDDNVLVQGVEGSPFAIGYFGFAYYTENADRLTALSINGIAPSAESAEDNSYPLSRPLFIYSDATIMAEKPQVAGFVNFYLQNASEVALEVGYFPASVEALNVGRQNFLDATGMGMTDDMSMAMELIELPAVDPLSLSGDIITAGSSTVFPVTEAMAELFTAEGFAGTITVDSIGSGAGLERFCVTGETDIANASRAIEEDEVAACEAIGRSPIEFRVGTDALAVVVSSENDFVTDLTIAQLAAIFTGEVTLWSDVDPSFPAETIQLFSPGTDSGTYDYFVEAVLESDEGAALEGEAANAAILGVPGIQFSEDDNVLVQGVEGSPYAIGYFGFAYYTENADRLTALSINGIAPSAESAEDNSYPLSRPLFIYGDATIMAEKPQVAGFVNFYLQNASEVALEVGYFPASVEALNVGRQNFLDAIGMGM